MTIPVEIQSQIEAEIALGHFSSPEDVLRSAMQALRNERTMRCDDDEALAGIRRGLADIAAGRYQALEEFDRDFRASKGIGDDV